MPYDLHAETLEDDECPMAWVERKLENEIGRLHDEIREEARQVSDQCILERTATPLHYGLRG
jgi:hypothetical protein